MNRFYLDDVIPAEYKYMSNDATRNVKVGKQNAHLDEKGNRGMRALGLNEYYLKRDHPNLYAWRQAALAAPFIVGAAPFVIGGAEALGSIAPIATAVSYAGTSVPIQLALRGLEASMMYHGIKDVFNGKFTPGTALELVPGIGWGRTLRPQNIRNIVFDNKIPFSYSGAWNSFKNMAKDVISLKNPNPLHPKWENEIKNYAKQMSEQLKGVGINIPAEDMYQSRWDAWAIHNRIPQKYDSFVEIGPNTYTAKRSVDRILNSRDYLPYIDPMSGLKITNSGLGWDWFNSSGGGVSRTYTPLAERPIGYGSRFAGVLRQTDYNDYQPFLRALTGDEMESSGDLLHTMIQSKFGDFIQNKIRRPLFNHNWLGGYVGKKNIRQTLLNPIDRLTLNRWRYTMPFDNKLKKVSNWIAPKIRDFEVGDITGGKPFYVVNEIPINGKIYKGEPYHVHSGFDEYMLENDNMIDYLLDRQLNGYYIPFTPKYRNGGSIHINPANRGKFNATKKRTSKTTEELTHSKNPLTRKRAIFAQNARKWKH